jgi:hypothetical protein
LDQELRSKKLQHGLSKRSMLEKTKN